MNRSTGSRGMWVTWKQHARAAKAEIYALYLAYKDLRVPWHARVFAACVVAYAFSPIDLIPDPIPVLGYLDDLVLLPIGVLLARQMIPSQVLEECRQKAQLAMTAGKPVNRVAAVIIIAVWLVCFAAVAVIMLRLVG